MKKTKKVLLLAFFVVLALTATVLAACIGGNEPAVITLNENYNGLTKTVQTDKEGKFDLGVSPAREGYDFLGWYKDAAGNQKFTDTVVTTDVTLYAKWQAKTADYVITYVYGAVRDTVNVAKNAEFVIPACKTETDAQIFEGYYTYSSGGKAYVGDTLTADKDMTFTAAYAKAYLIEFEANGGEGELPENAKYRRNERLTLPNALTHDTKIFACWADSDGMTYEAGEQISVTFSTKFTAKWVETYSLKFELSGGEMIGLPEIAFYQTGEKATVPTAVPTKLGYVFDCWFDGGFKRVQPGEKYEMGVKDTTLTAVWTMSGMVTFHDNTIEREIPVEDVILTPALGDKISPINAVNRADHEFLGWYVDPECTREWVFATDTVRGHVDLYAKWRHVYLRFFLTEDKSGYYVAGPSDSEVKNGTFTKSMVQALPQTLNLPSSYEGLPVYGIKSGVKAFQYLLTAEVNVTLGLSPIKTVVIPAEYTEIADEAFYYGRSLEHVVFEQPSDVARIGNWAFYQTNIKEIIFPEKVMAIGDKAFLFCENLSAIDMSLLGITEIKDSAFRGLVSLSDLKLPPRLEKIYAKAFQNTYKLAEINLPSTLTYIGTGAFGNYSGGETLLAGGARDLWECYDSIQLPDGSHTEDFSKTYSRLQRIVIPASVTFIGDLAFAWHKNATELIFEDEGRSLRHIGAYAFYHLESVSEIKLPASLEYLGGSLKYDNNGKVIGLNEVIEGAITYDDIRLYGSTFEGCYGITSIDLPECFSVMLPKMFRNCRSLENVTFANPNIDFNASNRAFANCVSLKTFEIPSTVTVIGDETFAGCTGLESVYFATGSQCMTIYSGAFSGCTKLNEIYLPDSVTAIFGQTFKDCAALTNIKLPENLNYLGTPKAVAETASSNTPYSSVFAGSGLTTLTLPSKVFFVSPYALSDAKNLREFIMVENSNLVSFHFYQDIRTSAIGSFTFKGCTSLQSVTLGNIFGGFNFETGQYATLPFGIDAFVGCTSLTEFKTHPGSKFLIAIDGVVFSGGENFDAPRSLMIYPSGKTATEYTVPDTIGSNSVAQIFSFAFMRNANLTKIILPSTIKTVSQQAFFGMTNLEEIVFEDNSLLESIGLQAFALLTNYPLNEYGQALIYLEPTKTPFKSITFTSAKPVALTSDILEYSTENADFAIYVPDASVELYKSAPYWSKLAKYIKPVSSKIA